FVNQGLLAADVPGGRIDVGRRQDNNGTDSGSLVNHGTLAASNGGFLYVHPDSWSSTGPLSAKSGGNVTLIHQGSNSGPITADGGGVYLDGSWTSGGTVGSSGGGLGGLA